MSTDSLPRENVVFSTYDGTVLRGIHFPAGAKAPIILMSHGLTGLKEALLLHASRFQAAGFSVLLYDHRNWGASDGLPRRESSHYQQTEDAYDAISYALTLPGVDCSRLAIWGTSFSGGIALTAGAVDPRIKLVIAQVPFVSGSTYGIPPHGVSSNEGIKKLMQDRTGTSFQSPTYVQCWPKSHAESLEPNDAVMGTEECWYAAEGGRNAGTSGTGSENSITLQTLFHLIRSEPGDYIPRIAPKPLLMVIGKKDSLLDPEVQIRAFGAEGKNKKLIQLDCSHFSLYRGDLFEQNVANQLEFLKQHL